MTESWRDLKKYKDDYEYHNLWDIYNYKYWDLTKKVNIELEIGKERLNKEIKDDELKDKDKYELGNEFAEIFTDGSVTREGINTGVGK